MNYFKNIPRSKSKIRSIKKDNNNINNNTEEDIEDQNIQIFNEKKKVNKNEQVGNYNISSPGTNFTTKKNLRQNKSNFAFINRRKNNILKPENTINNKNHITTMKTSNLNYYSKNEDETFNSYNSCYNFYKKDNIKKRLNNENNNIMSQTMNNFGMPNINSFQGNNSNINKLYGNITNHEIYQNENENGLNYINIIEQ